MARNAGMKKYLGWDIKLNKCNGRSKEKDLWMLSILDVMVWRDYLKTLSCKNH